MPSNLGKDVDKIIGRKIRFSRYDKEINKNIGFLRKTYLKTDDIINGRTSRNENIINTDKHNNNLKKYISEDKKFLSRKVVTTTEIKVSKLTGKENVIIREKKLFNRTKVTKMSLNKYERKTNPKNILQMSKNKIEGVGDKFIKKSIEKSVQTMKSVSKKGVTSVTKSDDSMGNKMLTEVVELPSQIRTAKYASKTVINGSKKVVQTTWNGARGTARGIRTGVKTVKKAKKISKTYKGWMSSQTVRKKMYKAGGQAGKKVGGQALKGVGKLFASLGKVIVSNFPVVAGICLIFFVVITITNALLGVSSALGSATYASDDASVNEIYNCITRLDKEYQSKINNIQSEWSTLKTSPMVVFTDYTTDWDGSTINSFNIINKYNPYSQTDSVLDYICTKYSDQEAFVLTITGDIADIYSKCNILYMTVSQANDYSNPIYEDDKSRPVYGNDYSKPIYGSDYSKPIYTEATVFYDYGEKFTNCKRSATLIYKNFPQNVLSQPSMMSSTVKQIDPNEEVEVIGMGDSFIKIKSGFIIAYARPNWFNFGSEQVIGYEQEVKSYEQIITGYEQKLVGYKQLYNMDISMKGIPTEYYIENNLKPLLTTEKKDLYDAYKEVGGMSMRTYIDSPFDKKTLLMLKKRYTEDEEMKLVANSGWKVKACMSGNVIVNGNKITIVKNEDGKIYMVTVDNITPTVSNGSYIISGNDIGTVANNDGVSITTSIDGKSLNPKLYMARELFEFSTAYGTTKDKGIDKFISVAQSYLGYFYYFGGKWESQSFDCSGFVCRSLQQSGYRTGVNASAQGLYQLCDVVSSSEVKAGDLIFFQGTYSTSDTVTHVGIVIDPINKIMLHCGDPIQYASYNTDYWNSHYYAYGRIR